MSDDAWQEEKPGQFRVWHCPFRGNLGPVWIPAFDTLDAARRRAWIEQLRSGRMADFFISRCSECRGEFHEVEKTDIDRVFALAASLIREAPADRFVQETY